MEFTGERYVPGVHGNIELEHLHRYYFACDFANSKTVLDIACGEGYGSALLARKAERVVGVDISDQTILDAKNRYRLKNLEFKLGSCTNIPMENSSVDLIVSFETIEHIENHDQMMKEVKRVLKPDGYLLISSPDKSNYSIKPEQSNPFHVKELFDFEFKELLGEYFSNINYLGQRILFGSHIISNALSSGVKSFFMNDDSLTSANGISDPLYLLALASDTQLPEIPSSIFEQPVVESELVQSLVQTLTDQLAQSQEELMTYATSKSWKITRPLRIIMGLLKGNKVV